MCSESGLEGSDKIDTFDKKGVIKLILLTRFFPSTGKFYLKLSSHEIDHGSLA